MTITNSNALAKHVIKNYGWRNPKANHIGKRVKFLA